MAEMMAENYHNIWAKKKKLELEAKGNVNYGYLQYFKFSVSTLDDTFQKTLKTPVKYLFLTVNFSAWKLL